MTALHPPHRLMPTATTEDLIMLLESIVYGNEDSLATLYHLTKKTAFSLILRILHNQAEAEEVLLDVYTQVWEQAARYQVSRGTPMAWLLTISRSRALDRLRADKNRLHCSEPLEVAKNASAINSHPEADALTSAMRRTIRRALNKLTVEQREVIELAYYSGFSHYEIAAKVNLPLGTVKTRIRLGMIQLRISLEDVREKQIAIIKSQSSP